MANVEYYTYKESPINGDIMMSVQVFDIITKECVAEDKDIDLDSTRGFSMSGSKNLVNCRIVDNQVYITVHIKVKYGVNVSQKTKNLQQRIASTIKEITNVDVKAVDIVVVNIEF
jgi:uncharacterized alkaline shock family protein YloU